MTAFLAVWLFKALGVASMASPVSLPLVIITAGRTLAVVLVDEVAATSAGFGPQGAHLSAYSAAYSAISSG